MKCHIICIPQSTGQLLLRKGRCRGQLPFTFKTGPAFLSETFRGSSFRSPWSLCSWNLALGPHVGDLAAVERWWAFNLVSPKGVCRIWVASSQGQQQTVKEKTGNRNQLDGKDKFWLFELKKSRLKASMAKKNLSHKDSTRRNDTGVSIMGSAHSKDNSLPYRLRKTCECGIILTDCFQKHFSVRSTWEELHQASVLQVAAEML